MCLLVVCNPNSTPSKDDLKMGACKNPHGFGFAIDTGDGIISERSMSAKKSIARFLELREQYPNGYAMWHARYATHGVKNELNCHPFKVVGKYDTYLAHNGVLDIHIPKDDKRSDTRIMAEELLPRLGGVSALDDDYVYDMISSWASGNKVVGEHDTYLAHNGVLDIHIPKDDKRSDTRIMAEELLPRLGNVSALDDDYVYDMISSWASGNKIAVMTNDPRAQYKIYIINENLGSWDDNGIWWSNNSYKPVVSTPRTTDYNYAYGNEPSVYDIVATDSHFDPSLYEENKFECPSCKALVDLWENEYYCQMCDSCFECEANFLECLCYNPKNKNMILDEYGYLNNKWYSKEPLDF